MKSNWPHCVEGRREREREKVIDSVKLVALACIKFLTSVNLVLDCCCRSARKGLAELRFDSLEKKKKKENWKIG